eukprot:63308_1
MSHDDADQFNDTELTTLVLDIVKDLSAEAHVDPKAYIFKFNSDQYSNEGIIPPNPRAITEDNIAYIARKITSLALPHGKAHVSHLSLIAMPSSTTPTLDPNVEAMSSIKRMKSIKQKTSNIPDFSHDDEIHIKMNKRTSSPKNRSKQVKPHKYGIKKVTSPVTLQRYFGDRFRFTKDQVNHDHTVSSKANRNKQKQSKSATHLKDPSISSGTRSSLCSNEYAIECEDGFVFMKKKSSASEHV